MTQVSEVRTFFRPAGAGPVRAGVKNAILTSIGATVENGAASIWSGADFVPILLQTEIFLKKHMADILLLFSVQILR